MSAKKKKIDSKKSSKLNIDISFPLDNKKNILIVCVLFVLTAGCAIFYALYSYNVNKENCFPLDDPWIQLTFARNLIEYGSYSYFKNEMVTAGSTSPIYTLILAAGYIFIKNEYILSFSLGILFFSLTTVTIYYLSKKLFNENWLGIVAALVFALDRWMNFFSVSGMETTLYAFLLILTYYMYVKRKALLLGISMALTLWARPDAMSFIAVIIIDYLIFLSIKKSSPSENKELNKFSKTELIKFSISFGIVILLYIGMNLMLSGTILPPRLLIIRLSSGAEPAFCNTKCGNISQARHIHC